MAGRRAFDFVEPNRLQAENPAGLLAAPTLPHDCLHQFGCGRLTQFALTFRLTVVGVKHESWSF